MSTAELFRLAATQHGYLTTAQAAEHGLSRRALAHRAAIGELTDAGYGLWRLTLWPAQPNEEMYALQALAPFGTFSHETALSLLDLGDFIPHEINLTIPEKSGFRARPGLRLHRSRLGAEKERILRDGLWISRPERALLDSAAHGADPEQLLSATRDALARGMLGPEARERLGQHRLFARLEESL